MSKYELKIEKMSTTSRPRGNKPPTVTSVTIQASRDNQNNYAISRIIILFNQGVDMTYDFTPTIIFPPNNDSIEIPDHTLMSFTVNRTTVTYSLSTTTGIDLPRYDHMKVSLSFSSTDVRSQIDFYYM